MAIQNLSAWLQEKKLDASVTISENCWEFTSCYFMQILYSNFKENYTLLKNLKNIYRAVQTVLSYFLWAYWFNLLTWITVLNIFFHIGLVLKRGVEKTCFNFKLLFNCHEYLFYSAFFYLGYKKNYLVVETEWI